MLDVSTQVVQPIIDGLFEGGILALAALGLSMIFSTLGVLNLAHGDFIMLGGFVGFLVSESLFSFARLGIFSIIGVLVSAFVVIAAFGAMYELAFIRFIQKRSMTDVLISSILVTVGTSFVIETVGYQLFPTVIPFGLTTFSINFPVQSLSINYGPISIEGAYIIAFITIAVSTLALYFFSRRTYLGKAMRAISQNRESALLMGINPNRISMLTFALGSGFGALAGVSVAMSTLLSPGVGIGFTISLLAVLVLGGTGSYFGPLVGGITIGLVEAFVQTDGSGLAEWYPAVSIIILIVVLMIRPTGLTGKRSGGIVRT